MVKLLTALGDTTLLERFIARVVTQHYDGSENDALVGAVMLLNDRLPRHAAGYLGKDIRHQDACSSKRELSVEDVRVHNDVAPEDLYFPVLPCWLGSCRSFCPHRVLSVPAVRIAGRYGRYLKS
jgi:hypothetical protein